MGYIPTEAILQPHTPTQAERRTYAQLEDCAQGRDVRPCDACFAELLDRRDSIFEDERWLEVEALLDD